ncbi:hypothetical protein, partial [Psychrobacter sp. CAL495-MNA-CIBAN-0180]|uniref:hypothetical protein n=1 Tax=Psychrobacter sp. CAL495-MNA-CIBAN-0180 TaxID=3140454 RepID=UPI00331BCB98
IMQVWADFLDLLRDKGEVVDFQTARQQIEKSMDIKKYDSLQDADKHELIDALVRKGVSIDELKELMKL